MGHTIIFVLLSFVGPSIRKEKKKCTLRGNPGPALVHFMAGPDSPLRGPRSVNVSFSLDYVRTGRSDRTASVAWASDRTIKRALRARKRSFFFYSFWPTRNASLIGAWPEMN